MLDGLAVDALEEGYDGDFKGGGRGALLGKEVVLCLRLILQEPLLHRLLPLLHLLHQPLKETPHLLPNDDDDGLARHRFLPASSSSDSPPSANVEKLTSTGAAIADSGIGETGENDADGLVNTGFATPTEMGMATNTAADSDDESTPSVAAAAVLQ